MDFRSSDYRTPPNSLLKVLDTEGLKNRLAAYPAKLKDERGKLSVIRTRAQEAAESLKYFKGVLSREIADEINPYNNKAKYSNQESRDAEFSIRAKNDPDYLGALNAYRKAESELEDAEIAYEQLQQSWLSIQKVADLVAAEIILLSKFARLEPMVITSD
jgi:hypothetical protein